MVALCGPVMPSGAESFLSRRMLPGSGEGVTGPTRMYLK